MTELELTTMQAADQLDMSQSEINSRIRHGQLPATRRGRFWMIRQSDLTAFAAQTGRTALVEGSLTPAALPNDLS